jgi:hypothetical protein
MNICEQYGRSDVMQILRKVKYRREVTDIWKDSGVSEFLENVFEICI